MLLPQPPECRNNKSWPSKIILQYSRAFYFQLCMFPTPQHFEILCYPNVLTSCCVPQLFLPLSLTDGSAASPEEVPDLNRPQEATSGQMGFPRL